MLPAHAEPLTQVPLIPSLITPSSIIPLFHALVDLPALVTAMQDAATQRNFTTRDGGGGGGGGGGGESFKSSPL